MSNLYEISEDMRFLQSIADDPEADLEAVKDTLEGVEMEFEDKAQNIAFICKNDDAMIEGIDKEIARLTARKNSYKNHKKWLYGYLESCMRATGKLKFKTALFSFGIQKNGGKKPLVLDVSPEELPFEYQRVKVEADGDRLRSLLDSGEECKYAHYEERGESLRIR